MNDENEGFDGVSILVASIGQDVAQEAKEMIVERCMKALPDTPTQVGAVLTATVMVMDSAIEAALNSGRRNPKHPMVACTLHMFDTILAPNLAELRRMQERASG